MPSTGYVHVACGPFPRVQKGPREALQTPPLPAGKRFPGLDFQKHKDKRTLVKMTAIKRAGVRMGRKALQAARDAAAAAYAGYNSSDTEGEPFFEHCVFVACVQGMGTQGGCRGWGTSGGGSVGWLAWLRLTVQVLITGSRRGCAITHLEQCRCRLQVTFMA